MTVARILSAHPAPWKHQVRGGEVQLLDAAGKPVPLFTMLSFVEQVTQVIVVRERPSPAPAPADPLAAQGA